MTQVAAFQASAQGEAITIGGGSGQYPAIMQNGHQIGVYIDNEVPGRCQIAEQQSHLWPLVIVSYFGFPQQHVGQHPCPHAPGIVNALEWYLPAQKPPPAQAYILQRKFHFPKDPAVPRWKQTRLFHWALAHKPQFIIWY